MPARTNSEKIEAAEKEAFRLNLVLEKQQVIYDGQFAEMKTRCGQLVEKVQSIAADSRALDERLKSVEKLDKSRVRSWQLRLAVFSAASGFVMTIISATVALSIAIAKR